jgi:hypothetical protein
VRILGRRAESQGKKRRQCIPHAKVAKSAKQDWNSIILTVAIFAPAGHSTQSDGWSMA